MHSYFHSSIIKNIGNTMKIIKVDFSVRGKGLRQLEKERKEENKIARIERRIMNNIEKYKVG